MNLSYSAEYEQFRQEVRAFLREHWTDEDKASVPAPDPQSVAASMGAGVRTDERATAFRLKAIERGYLYRHVPKRYGGAEQPADALKATIVAEEFRRHDAPYEILGQGPSMLAPTLIEKGTEAHKERFVRDTLPQDLLATGAEHHDPVPIPAWVDPDDQAFGHLAHLRAAGRGTPHDTPSRGTHLTHMSDRPQMSIR